MIGYKSFTPTVEPTACSLSEAAIIDPIVQNCLAIVTQPATIFEILFCAIQNGFLSKVNNIQRQCLSCIAVNAGGKWQFDNNILVISFNGDFAEGKYSRLPLTYSQSISESSFYHCVYNPHFPGT